MSTALEVVRSTPRANQPAPRMEDIREQAAGLGFKRPSEQLVTDLCNIASGGIVHDDRTIEDDLRDARNRELGMFSLARWGLARDTGFPMILTWNLALAELLRQIKPKEVPGRNDEQRALSMTALSEAIESEIDKGTKPKEIAEALAEAFDAVDGLDEAELSLLGGLPHPVDMLEQPPPGESGDIGESDDEEEEDDDTGRGGQEREETISEGILQYSVPDPASSNYDKLSHSLQQAEISRRLLEDRNLGKLLDVARVLRDFVRLNVRRTVREMPDPEGPDLRWRDMRSMSELVKVPQREWALRSRSPLMFRYRLAQKLMTIRERTRRETRKQLLYVLLDCSSSMRMGLSRYKLGGVMMNRLAAVTRGDAVLIYRFFGTKLYEEHRVETAEQSRDALRHVLSCRFPDRETKLSPALRRTLSRIKTVRKEEELERPHLLVVTDGSVTAKLTAEDLGDVVLHLVLIERQGNYDSLLQLAKYSGGVVIENF